MVGIRLKMDTSKGFAPECTSRELIDLATFFSFTGWNDKLNKVFQWKISRMNKLPLEALNFLVPTDWKGTACASICTRLSFSNETISANVRTRVVHITQDFWILKWSFGKWYFENIHNHAFKSLQEQSLSARAILMGIVWNLSNPLYKRIYS